MPSYGKIMSGEIAIHVETDAGIRVYAWRAARNTVAFPRHGAISLPDPGRIGARQIDLDQVIGIPAIQFGQRAHDKCQCLLVVCEIDAI
jgi:hypothetical protein